MSLENLFLVLNLGCEMIYVIDQRLMAQKVAADKSAQVLRDLTEVLLDHKFLNYVTMHFQNRMLTTQQARSLLSDIACCSLMRLDANSMDKLWELMVMIFKWQLFLTKSSQNLMDITFRHLDGIARIMPELRKTIHVDATKQILIEYWDTINNNARGHILNNLQQWLRPFNTKISVLIRLQLQHMDGSFVDAPQENAFFDYYCENLGTNVYAKTTHLMPKELDKATKKPSPVATPEASHEFDTLSDQLGLGAASSVPMPVFPAGMLNLADMLGMVSVDMTEENKKKLSLDFGGKKETSRNEDLGDLV